MTEKQIISDKIKAEALRLGFSACGIASAEKISKQTESFFTRWISHHYQAGMKYMENYPDQRKDPRLLIENARSIICVALNYYPRKRLRQEQYQFAWYAYGKDYHELMKQKLAALYSYICKELFPAQGRYFCDTAPIHERYWAWKAGLGWIGKNTQLIIPQAGSCFFLGELIIDQELAYDTPGKNRCGRCIRCLQNCPANALEKPYTLNANRCLSYLTIENRGEIPEKSCSQLGNRIYGCDECQKACPWNRFAVPTTLPELHPTEEFLSMQPGEWEKLTEEKYRKLFKGSAVKRAKFEGLMRNIRAVSTHLPTSSTPYTDDRKS